MKGTICFNDFATNKDRRTVFLRNFCRTVIFLECNFQLSSNVSYIPE